MGTYAKEWLLSQKYPAPLLHVQCSFHAQLVVDTYVIPLGLNNYMQSLTLGSQKNTTMLCNCSCVLLRCLLLISNGIHSNCMAFPVLFKEHQLVLFIFFFFNNKMPPLLISYKGAFTWFRFNNYHYRIV